MVLNFIVYFCTVAIIFDMEGLDSDMRRPGIVHGDPHAVDIILKTIKFREFPIKYSFS